MGPEEEPAEPAAGEISEASTLGDGDWPVDDRYFVEPDEHPVQSELERVQADEGGEIAAPPAAAARPRAVALAAAVLIALLLAAALGAWLVLRPAHSRTSGATPSPAQPRTGGPVTTTSSSTTTGSTTTPKVPKPTKPVPDATGLALADARTRLSKAGLRVRVRSETSSAPEGRVLRQTPASGSKLRPDASVVLTVSSGPARVTLPALVGLRADTAARRARALGLVPRLRTVRTAKPAGTVLGQDPGPGGRVARGSSVRLEVAKSSPEPAVARVRVPSVAGLTAAAARSRLAAAGLDANVAHVASSKPEGVVVEQSPAAGTRARKGSTVRLGVSSGPALVAVPSVVGLDRQSAQDELQAAGFRVRVVTETTSDPSQDGTVTAQDPQDEAPDGATVTITVAQL